MHKFLKTVRNLWIKTRERKILREKEEEIFLSVAEKNISVEIYDW